MREIVVVHLGTAVRHGHRPFVGGTDEEVVCHRLAHLLLVLVAVVARLPSGVLWDIEIIIRDSCYPSAGQVVLIKMGNNNHGCCP